MNRFTMLSAAAIMGVGGVVQAQSVDDVVADKVMYGITRSSAQIMSYNFAEHTLTSGPIVQDSTGAAFTNIDSAAYFPGFTNAYAFQQGADGKQRLIYVNMSTGLGTVVADDMEGGRVMGATGVIVDGQYKVFGIQQAKVRPPSTIVGALNINPNNSQQNEFTLTKDNGVSITRDDLHMNTSVDGAGIFYQGGATFLHVKPKGNGNQNSLVVNGEVFTVQNANTYDFQGQMQVRVWNDHIKNSKAMGHWWISIISGEVYVNGETQIESPNRVVEVDVQTGTVTELVTLNDPCTGLASSDGNTFYTFDGNNLVTIDVSTETADGGQETSSSETTSVNVVGSYLIAHDGSNDKFVAIDPSTGDTVGSPADLGTDDLGATFFTTQDQDPANAANPYD